MNDVFFKSLTGIDVLKTQRDSNNTLHLRLVMKALIDEKSGLRSHPNKMCNQPMHSAHT